MPWDFHESQSILLQDGEKLEREEAGMVCLDPARFGLLFLEMVASPEEMSLFSRTAGTTIPPTSLGSWTHLINLNQSGYPVAIDICYLMLHHD